MSPSVRDSPMANQLSEADVILNRTNVALARSQRLIQSWLPAKTAAEESSTEQAHEEDEDDFIGLDELGGLGSKRKADDEGLPDGAFRRKKLASNEKLLEQLLGKKAAQARKQALEGSSRASAGMGLAAPKVMPARLERKVESEDEEEGRAASFKSRKPRARAAHAAPVVVQTQVEEGPDAEEADNAQAAPPATHIDRSAATDDAEPEERPSKRKAGSYLDEVLGQKANKKKKNKKKKQQQAGVGAQ
ncbi:hypothetical protein LTR85_011926 [Meristemomyces frigidus]|nr:hypothetical protein LTR85_011926 [Meristemomyces frigidus]